MPAENDTGALARRRPSPSRQAASSRRIDDVGAVGVGAGQDDRELVAADPERPVRCDAGRPSMIAAAWRSTLVAGRMAARVVDLLELVEVERARAPAAGCTGSAIDHWRSISSWNARWLPRPVSASRSASDRARS